VTGPCFFEDGRPNKNKRKKNNNKMSSNKELVPGPKIDSEIKQHQGKVA